LNFVLSIFCPKFGSVRRASAMLGLRLPVSRRSRLISSIPAFSVVSLAQFTAQKYFFFHLQNETANIGHRMHKSSRANAAYLFERQRTEERRKEHQLPFKAAAFAKCYQFGKKYLKEISDYLSKKFHKTG
jgi:hypothetical protein